MTLDFSIQQMGNSSFPGRGRKLVTGAGFEPTTSGLDARVQTTGLTPDVSTVRGSGPSTKWGSGTQQCVALTGQFLPLFGKGVVLWGERAPRRVQADIDSTVVYLAAKLIREDD